MSAILAVLLLAQPGEPPSPAVVAPSVLAGFGAQDAEKKTLAWKPAEGQKALVTWTIAARAKVVAEGKVLLSFDLAAELSGRLSVASITRDGKSECLISVRRHEIRGRVKHAPVHFLLEDGELKVLEGFNKDAKDLPKLANAPIWLKLPPNGAYTAESTEEVTRFFAGQDGVLGPVLPDRPVKAGDTWTATLALADAKTLGMKELTGTYKFAGVEKFGGVECAKIVMDETIEATLKGVKVTNTIKREAWFDPGAGRCIRAKKSWRAAGSGEVRGEKGSVDMEFSINFDMEPIEK